MQVKHHDPLFFQAKTRFAIGQIVLLHYMQTYQLVIHQQERNQ